MLKKVIQVRPNRDYTVHVYLEDGHIKLFDMKPFLNKGVFKQISNLDSFVNLCTVMNGTLSWDLSGVFDPTHCIDITAKTIYNSGISESDPLEHDSA